MTRAHVADVLVVIVLVAIVAASLVAVFGEGKVRHGALVVLGVLANTALLGLAGYVSTTVNRRHRR